MSGGAEREGGFVPGAVAVGKDTEERDFRSLVKSWVGGEISYGTLMRNYPSHRIDPLGRLSRKVQEFMGW